MRCAGASIPSCGQGATVRTLLTHTWNHKYTHTKRTTSSGLGRCPGPGGAGGAPWEAPRHPISLEIDLMWCPVARGHPWGFMGVPGGHGVSDGVSEIFHRSVRSFFFWAPRAPRHPSRPPPRFQWSTRPHASSQVAEARAWRSLTTSGLKPLREGRRRSDLGPRYRATWSSLGFLSGIPSFLGVPGFRSCHWMGRDGLPSIFRCNDSQCFLWPRYLTDPTKETRGPERFCMSAGTGQACYAETVRSGRQSAREENPPPRRSRGISRRFPEPGHAGPRIHIQDQRSGF